MGRKKGATLLLFFSGQLSQVWTDFDKTVLSLLHSTINCGENWNQIYHLTLNPLSYYLAKFERSAVHLYRSYSCQKLCTESFISASCLPEIITFTIVRVYHRRSQEFVLEGALLLGWGGTPES